MTGAAITLAHHLTDIAATWLAAACIDVQQHPSTITRYFPAVSRRCGRAVERKPSSADYIGLRRFEAKMAAKPNADKRETRASPTLR